jgi:long-chain acyl-CoA synthetase
VRFLMLNMTAFVDNHARTSDRTAVISPSQGKEYTYSSLLSMMSRIAGDLSDQGIRRGDRVCIYLDSSPEYLASYFAIWRLGAVAVPANIAYREAELRHALADAGARGLIHCDTG